MGWTIKCLMNWVFRCGLREIWVERNWVGNKSGLMVEWAWELGILKIHTYTYILFSQDL